MLREIISRFTDAKHFSFRSKNGSLNQMRLIASSSLLKPHTDTKDFFLTIIFGGGQPCGSVHWRETQLLKDLEGEAMYVTSHQKEEPPPSGATWFSEYLRRQEHIAIMVPCSNSSGDTSLWKSVLCCGVYNCG